VTPSLVQLALKPEYIYWQRVTALLDLIKLLFGFLGPIRIVIRARELIEQAWQRLLIAVMHDNDDIICDRH